LVGHESGRIGAPEEYVHDRTAALVKTEAVDLIFGGGLGPQLSRARRFNSAVDRVKLPLGVALLLDTCLQPLLGYADCST